MPPPDVHRLRPGTAAGRGSPPDATNHAAPRGFVPLELLGPILQRDADASGPPGRLAPEVPPPFVIADPDVDWSERTSLFGEPEG
jgi:hypothetical protein